MSVDTEMRTRYDIEYRDKRPLAWLVPEVETVTYNTLADEDKLLLLSAGYVTLRTLLNEDPHL